MTSMTEKIDRLLQSITNMGCNITEAREDLNTYVASFSFPKKGEFVVYTNNLSYIYDGDWCFRMLQLTERVPFYVIENKLVTFQAKESFVEALKKIVVESGKLVATYSSGFSAEQLEFYVKSAKNLK